MLFKEIQGDLFQASKEYALAHCISSDCAMGAGIAKQFVSRYPGIKDYCQNQPIRGIGSVIKYQAPDGRTIFNLITKEKFFHKPTYDTLMMALFTLRSQMLQDNLKKLAIPRLGCGLDKLDWNKVKYLIQYIFQNTDIEIVVYHLDQANQ